MIQQLKIFWYSRNNSLAPPDYHSILTKYNDYYRRLSPELQKDFLVRVYICEQLTEFRPIQFDYVSTEMKVVIISALIEITFGLDKYVLTKFKTILIAPNIYKFGPYPALHGHVDHDKKLIVMAWPSVKQGFIIPQDAHNVALHELAHALQLENHSALFFADFFDAVAVNQWEQIGLIELWKIKRNQQHYLRDYAGKNMLELFAVSMECFFEQPEAFKEKVPQLYLIMTKLLLQDPCKYPNPLLKRTVS